jgi:hypothetical protein
MSAIVAMLSLPSTFLPADPGLYPTATEVYRTDAPEVTRVFLAEVNEICLQVDIVRTPVVLFCPCFGPSDGEAVAREKERLRD